MFDLCIVGGGLIGSAAARHASLIHDGRRVCLIGPSEPKERSSKTDRDIYGAYYDEGRITRCCDPDPVWATLAVESIKRYREIEKQSGRYGTMDGCVLYHKVAVMVVPYNTERRMEVPNIDRTWNGWRGYVICIGMTVLVDDGTIYVLDGMKGAKKGLICAGDRASHQCLFRLLGQTNLLYEYAKFGISIYSEVGNLMVGSGANSKYITSIKGAAQACNVDVKPLDNTSLHEQCPYLNFPEDAHAVLETKNAGFVNPRKLVDAQKMLASRHGCTIIDDVVRKVDRIVQSDGVYIMRIETESGREYFAKSVLLATGAFTRFRNLLPYYVHVQHAISPLAVAFLEVEMKGSTDQSISNMPCVLYKGRGYEGWCIPDLYKNREDIYFYLLPPIKYPDGRFYIKLGFINPEGKKVESRDDLKRWYDEGDNAFQEAIAKFIESLFKGVKFVSWKGDSCAIMDTPTVRPYVDQIHDQLGVAIGGNGYAAKSSDEIGRLGASMMLSGWSSEIPRDVFNIKYCTNSRL